MAIRIVRNDAGNCVNFIGTTNPAYWNACLSAEVDASATDRINIINDIRTQQASGTVYEFYNIPYTEFVDADGSAFPTAASAAAYITEKANVATNTGQFTLSETDTLDFSLDSTKTTVLVDNGDSYSVNSIRAGENASGHIDILKHSGSTILFSDLRVSGCTVNSRAVDSNVTNAVNELNALFQQTGGSLGDAPSITSASSIALTEGDTLNYELIASDGVGFEWSGLPAGVTTVEGNTRKLIGGSELAVGTYNLRATAINYYGTASKDINLVVSAPAFSNTKSVSFANQDWMGANASLLEAELGRSSNGAGSGDAWSISLWFKGSTDTSNGQTIFYFGNDDVTNGGHMYLRYQGGNNRVRFRYGSGSNHLNFHSADNSIVDNTWHHIFIAYDGGTTGASSGDINSYYGRFSIYIDGSNAVPGGTWSESNYGWSSSIVGQNLRVGRYQSSQYLQGGCKVDELAIWGSDQTANIANIYNSGAVHNLSALATGPDHWWRMGDGDTYPNIQDNVGTAHFVMYNMTAADIVSDTPS